MINRNEIETILIDFSAKLKNIDSATVANDAVETLIKEILQTEFASLWIYKQDSSLLIRFRDTPTKIDINNKKGILYKSLMTKELSIYNNLTTDLTYVDSIDNPDSINIYSKIILPIIENDELLGIATAYSTFQNQKDFTEYDSKLFKIILPYIKDTICVINQCCNLQDDEKLKKHKKNLQIAVDKLNDLKYAKDEFNYLSAMVHDISIPANNLYGFLALLEDKLDDPRLKHYVANAKESADFIDKISKAILSRVANNTKEQIVECEVVNSVSFFSHIADEFVSNMYNKHISFNIFIDPLIPKEIRIDALKLKRTIINLIDNAYKFTPKNRCIEFSVEYNQIQKKLEIIVKDNGIGISLKKRQELIESFNNEYNSNISNGIGLAICACYINEFDGKLSIDSELGKGSKFHFDVPLQEYSSTPTFKQINNPNAKVLILLDEKNSCSANNIAKQLVRLGLKKEQIKAVSSLDNIDEDTTHIISFQNKLTLDVVMLCNKQDIKNLIVEEKLFSISRSQANCTHQIVSQYGYFTNTLYSFINTKQLPIVLIVDDNQINMTLLKKMLSEELCIVESATTGDMAIEMVQSAIKKKRYYSAIYMDELESAMSCDEVVNKIRFLEKQSGIENATIASLSSNTKNKNYDIFVSKPFKREEISMVLTRSLKSK